jgi:hypothetical protein
LADGTNYLANACFRERDAHPVARHIDGDAHALARESGFGAIASGRAGDGYSIRP